MAEHAWQDGLRIDWEGVKILYVASNHQERLVKEAVHIRLSIPGLRMNRDAGKEISCVWQGPMKKLTSRNVHLRGRRILMQTTPTNTASVPPTVASHLTELADR